MYIWRRVFESACWQNLRYSIPSILLALLQIVCIWSDHERSCEINRPRYLYASVRCRVWLFSLRTGVDKYGCFFTCRAYSSGLCVCMHVCVSRWKMLVFLYDDVAIYACMCENCDSYKGNIKQAANNGHTLNLMAISDMIPIEVAIQCSKRLSLRGFLTHYHHGCTIVHTY